MNPFAQRIKVNEPSNAKRAKTLERARKNIESDRRRGRLMAVFQTSVVIVVAVLIAIVLRESFESMLDSTTTLDQGMFVVLTAMCCMLGFKLGFYSQMVLGQMFGLTSDEMLVEYHDRLVAAGLLTESKKPGTEVPG